MQKTFADSPNSWSVNVREISNGERASLAGKSMVNEDETSRYSSKPTDATYDLSAKNPNKKEETALRKPEDILAEIKALDEESEEILESIKNLI